jgi:hypothetical protein
MCFARYRRVGVELRADVVGAGLYRHEHDDVRRAGPASAIASVRPSRVSSQFGYDADDQGEPLGTAAAVSAARAELAGQHLLAGDVREFLSPLGFAGTPANTSRAGLFTRRRASGRRRL